MQTEENFKQIEKIAKALGDKNRLIILKTISEKGCVNCTEFTEIVNLAQPSVSHHIKILTEAGLIDNDKAGRFVKLCINKDKLQEMIDFLMRIKNL